MSKSNRAAAAVIALAPLARLHSNLHLNISFIATYVPENDSFSSARGDSEVAGDFWELCAIENYQEHLKYLDFLVCLSQQYIDIPSNTEACVTETGLDMDLMKDCVEKDGPSLLKRSIQVSQEAGLDTAQDSVIFINGQRYDGQPSQVALEEALCSDPSLVDGGSELFDKWWFYFIIAVGVAVGSAVLVAGLLTVYRIFSKCNKASDMWLRMIKTDPGNALNFADKVQDAMNRFEKEGNYDSLGGVRDERGMEEGRSHVYTAGGGVTGAGSYSVNSGSVPYSLAESPSSPDLYEESPLLPSFSTGWSMGGVRE